MKIVHFCAGLEHWNGMANTARQFVVEERKAGHDSHLTNDPTEIVGKIDVVQIHGSWLPVLWKVAKQAKKIGVKLIIRPAGSYDPVRRHFHGWKKKLVAFWEHRMLDRADVIQATCKEEGEWIRAYHPKAHVELTDLKRFFDLSKPVTFPAPKKERTPIHVLYLGRRHPLKGVKYLELAVADLNYYCRSCIPGCEDMDCVELKIVSDVYGEKLEEIWKWCDVLVLPTLSENFGRVVAEALEHGKPVITTDGAPVWSNLKPEQGYYLKGYREGSERQRIDLLRQALTYFVG